MKAEKIREWSDAELGQQIGEVQDRLFRLRFQMSMGQTEGLKKYKDLKKDRARMMTTRRQREVGKQ